MLKKISKSWLVVCLLIALLVMGANNQGMKEQMGEALLSRTTGVAMGTNNTKAILYTVPVGKKCIVTKVVIHTLGAAVACGNDNDFGDGASADTWKTAINLSTLDATDDYWQVTNNNALIEATFDAGDEFGIMTDVGSSASAVSAVIDVIGYLFNE